MKRFIAAIFSIVLLANVSLAVGVEQANIASAENAAAAVSASFAKDNNTTTASTHFFTKVKQAKQYVIDKVNKLQRFSKYFIMGLAFIFVGALLLLGVSGQAVGTILLISGMVLLLLSLL